MYTMCWYSQKPWCTHISCQVRQLGCLDPRTDGGMCVCLCVIEREEGEGTKGRKEICRLTLQTLSCVFCVTIHEFRTHCNIVCSATRHQLIHYFKPCTTHQSIQKGGNRQAREMYEANLPANFRRPQDD